MYSFPTSEVGVFLLPLDGMLVHHRPFARNLLGFPNNLPVPIYTPGGVERGTVKVKCLAQEHNTVSPARAVLYYGILKMIHCYKFYASLIILKPFYLELFWISLGK